MKIITRIKSKLTIGLIVLFGLIGISTELNDFEIAKNLEIFSNIYKELNMAYVDDIDPEHLMEIGINAMLHSLDPYTTYIPAKEVEEFRSTITGQYVGIGTPIIETEGGAIIMIPYENSPAQLAGLRLGDKLLEINGKSVLDNTVNDISNKIRGLPNSEVKIKVQRYGIEEPLIITIKRQEINVENIPYYGMLENNLAYIILNSFSENAGKNVATALSKLKEAHTVEGVILDLRGNGGGLLGEAVNVANVFLDKGSMITQIKGRDKDLQQVFRTLNHSIDNKVPVCVLIDNTSASASEIVAGAIQDLDRGVIIGQRSFGKGLVQSTRDLSFGGVIKLTTARYYIPSGRCIQALKYENGKAVAVIDTLHTPYTTQNGRPVFDGGGIKPDIVIDNQAFLKITMSLNGYLHLFDFASWYYSEHKTIPAGQEFKLTDIDFKDFLAFLKRRGYSYKTETEELLEKLQKTTEKEHYGKAIEAELKGVKTVLENSREGELEKHKESILQVLQSCIASHYYNERGALEAGINRDIELQKAQEILLDKEAYKKILTAK